MRGGIWKVYRYDKGVMISVVNSFLFIDEYLGSIYFVLDVVKLVIFCFVEFIF